jgi:hypothetical protein
VLSLPDLGLGPSSPGGTERLTRSSTRPTPCSPSLAGAGGWFTTGRAQAARRSAQSPSCGWATNHRLVGGKQIRVWSCEGHLERRRGGRAGGPSIEHKAGSVALKHANDPRSGRGQRGDRPHRYESARLLDGECGEARLDPGYDKRHRSGRRLPVRRLTNGFGSRRRRAAVGNRRRG